MFSFKHMHNTYIDATRKDILNNNVNYVCVQYNLLQMWKKTQYIGS